MIKKLLKFIYSIVMFLLALIINFFANIFNKKEKKVWLIAEQAHMARDNGIAFYDYCINKDNIDAYYVIDFNCSDYNSIKNKKNLIKFYSLKHYIYYLRADTLIMCFPDGICPSVLLEKILRNLHLLKNKKVYLKHGIIKDYIKLLTKDNFKVDMFVTASKKEYNYIVNNYGHDKDVIKLLGLCRYDYLKDSSNDDIKILIMPTWRRWIKGNLKDTVYYKKYNNLINKLSKKYKNTNIKVYFYMHNNFQKYTDSFESTDVVKILSSNDYKVNELINKCNLMITDYSSVAFDFAYLKKPIIYFQFDYKDVLDKHYQKGYFDYKRDGFGPVINDVDEIIKYLDKIKFKNTKKYINRLMNFYEFNDENNRERTFNEILKL